MGTPPDDDYEDPPHVGLPWISYGSDQWSTVILGVSPVPVMAKPVIKGSDSKSRLWMAREMAKMLAKALCSREV
jgi:hypothetical protein